MHTIKLEVQDSIYDYIMFLLKNLNTKELKIVEENIQNTNSIEGIEDTAQTEAFSSYLANLLEKMER